MNLLDIPIASQDGTALLTVAIDGIAPYQVSCYVLEGGQRLLLPQETSQKIFDALLEGQNVTLSADYYCITLPCADFATLFNQQPTENIEWNLIDKDLLRQLR